MPGRQLKRRQSFREPRRFSLAVGLELKGSLLGRARSASSSAGPVLSPTPLRLRRSGSRRLPLRLSAECRAVTTTSPFWSSSPCPFCLRRSSASPSRARSCCCSRLSDCWDRAHRFTQRRELADQHAVDVERLMLAAVFDDIANRFAAIGHRRRAADARGRSALGGLAALTLHRASEQCRGAPALWTCSTR